MRQRKKLNILGLMVLPNDKNSKNILKFRYLINLGLKDLSMGMSSDYKDAILNNSTYVRIGSSILEIELNQFSLLFFY